MKKVISLVVLVITLLSCNSTGQKNNVVVTQSQSTNNNIEVKAEDIPGFNVALFADLVKTTANPQLLEQKINDPNSGINTLDLDKDGNVDYLKVIENQNQLVVVDETKTNQITIATLNINPNGDVNVSGVQTYCGQNYNYHNHYSLTDAILLSYILRPHRYYVPVYHYGYYPSYYRSSTVISTRTRIISTRTVTKTPSTTYRNNSSTNNISKTPSTNRTSLSNPSTSQRSFTPRNTSTPVRSGGFSSSVRSSFGSSSRSSSFGGRRK